MNKKKKLVLLFGLPLSGKTTWYKNNKDKFKDFTYVNADDIKESLPEYNPDIVGSCANEGIKLAKEAVFELFDYNKNIIMDAGAINNKYTLNIAVAAKQRDYFIEMYFIDTPYQICLERNKQRKRKVPNELILEKETKKLYHWNKYKNIKLFPTDIHLIDKFYHIEYFTHKHLFFDMDGVLAAQINLPEVMGEIDFVNSKHFMYLPVVEEVKQKVEKIYDLAAKHLYILSASPTSFSTEEKLLWLKAHFPFIKEKNIFFVNSGQYKAEMFRDLAKRLKINKRDMTLIEDTHSIIKDVKKRYNMNAIHVSEFLTKNFIDNEYY